MDRSRFRTKFSSPYFNHQSTQNPKSSILVIPKQIKGVFLPSSSSYFNPLAASVLPSPCLFESLIVGVFKSLFQNFLSQSERTLKS